MNPLFSSLFFITHLVLSSLAIIEVEVIIVVIIAIINQAL